MGAIADSLVVIVVVVVMVGGKDGVGGLQLKATLLTEGGTKAYGLVGSNGERGIRVIHETQVLTISTYSSTHT